jgi:hypothetical protein
MPHVLPHAHIPDRKGVTRKPNTSKRASFVVAGPLDESGGSRPEMAVFCVSINEPAVA